MSLFDFDRDPDWISTNESDGMKFYGFDDDDGTTAWYDEDGTLDSCTDSPSDDDCNEYLERY